MLDGAGVVDDEVTREDDVVDSLLVELGTTGFGVELVAGLDEEGEGDDEELDDGVSLSHFTLMPAVALEGTSLPGFRVMIDCESSFPTGLSMVPAGSFDVFVVVAETLAWPGSVPFGIVSLSSVPVFGAVALRNLHSRRLCFV